MADEIHDTQLNEAGASENSLSPGGGTAGGDLKINTIAAIVAQLGTMSHEDINGFAASLRPPQPVSGGNAANMASIKSSAALKPVIKEDLIKIFAGEEALSESFIESATTLFEAAIATRVAVEMEAIEQSFETRMNEETEGQIAAFTERLDSYLDHIAEEFVKENAVAIDNGIRVELAESLISGLGQLFVEHNVNVPEDKVDVVSELEAQVADLNARLNEATSEAIEANARVEQFEVAGVVAAVSEGMVETDRARLAELAESISYTDLDDLKEKLTAVRATVVTENTTTTTDTNGLILEEVDVDNAIVEATPSETTTTNPNMQRYLDAVSAQLRHK